MKCVFLETKDKLSQDLEWATKKKLQKRNFTAVKWSI